MESGHRRAPLNLKVLAYQGDCVRAGEALPLQLLDLKTVLMPRQWFLNKLDPHGDLTVPELRAILEQHMIKYKALVLQDFVTPWTTVKNALDIYKKFHF